MRSCPRTCGRERLPGPSDVKVTSLFTGLSRFDDVLVIGAGLRAKFLERIEGKYHVLRRHRRAVVPFRFGAQSEGGKGEVVRVAQRLGEEPIAARYLVERWHQQRVVVEVDADGERAFHAVDHDVEVVVGAAHDLSRGTALGGGGVDIVELLEACRIFQVAEH